MKILEGNLQQAVDSFDMTKQNDKQYVGKFIDTVLTPALCTFVAAPVDPAFTKWDGICGYFHVEQPMKLKLFPESNHS